MGGCVGIWARECGGEVMCVCVYLCFLLFLLLLLLVWGSEWVGCFCWVGWEYGSRVGGYSILRMNMLEIDYSMVKVEVIIHVSGQGYISFLVYFLLFFLPTSTGI